jgi:Rieske Fe-S protein
MTTEHVRVCEGCAVRNVIPRREFVLQSTLMAVAAALSACGGGDNATGPTGDPAGQPPGQGTPTTITVRPVDFPVLASVGGVVRVPNTGVAVARTGASAYRAFSMECTHAGTTVVIRADNTIRCPNHGAEFAFDGTWTGGTQNTTSLVVLTSAFDATTGVLTITR